MNKRIFKEQTTESGDVPFYKIGTFGGVADAYISNDLYDEYTKKYPHPKQGDVLISASGSIGRTVEYSGRREYFQDSNIVWLQHDDSIKNEFLKYFYEVVKWEGLEGSTIKRLYNKNILDTKILMPDTLEQTKIGAFFKKLDNLITLHQRKYFLLKMFLQKSNLLYTYAWEQRKLSSIATMHARIGWQNLRTSEFLDRGNYYLITGTDFIDGEIDLKTCHFVEKERYDQDKNIQIKNGSILITKDGTLGKVAYVEGLDKPATLNAGVFNVVIIDKNMENKYLFHYLKAPFLMDYVGKRATGGTIKHLNQNILVDFPVIHPSYDEQTKIGAFFSKLDNLITLHQRKYFLVSINLKKKKEICFMLNSTQSTDLFCDYYAKWIKIYKEGAIRKVTLDKYLMTCEWLKRLIPTLMICELNRITYQQLINDYAELHERQTTMDFHHQLKGAILDAVDEGFIEKDPTRKAIIKGKTPRDKKIKFLNQFELHTMLTHLNLTEKITWDWFILLVAKTGMRFSEALALTPKDFDFAHQSLSISKTWNYKEQGGFLPTKNKSSVRKIEIDWQTVIQFSELLKNLPPDMPIFVKYGEKIYNSTVNGILERHCKAVNIPIISIHGLRHTHASLLLFAGVSIASVARRLGHSSITTTQKTYLHIIHELENQDVDLVMRSLSGLS